MRKIQATFASLLGATLLFAAGPAPAQETLVVGDFIQAGQRYLLATQRYNSTYGSGYWDGYSSSYRAGVTCAAILALSETATRNTDLVVDDDEGGNPVTRNVGEAMDDGVRWILENAIWEDGSIGLAHATYEGGLCAAGLAEYTRNADDATLAQFNDAFLDLGVGDAQTGAGGMLDVLHNVRNYLVDTADGANVETVDNPEGGANPHDFAGSQYADQGTRAWSGWGYDASGEDLSASQFSIMGIAWVSTFLGEPLVRGRDDPQWLSRVFNYLKLVHGDPNGSNYGGFDAYYWGKSASYSSMTGAGIWSLFLLQNGLTSANDIADKDFMLQNALNWTADNYPTDSGAIGAETIGWAACQACCSYYYCIWANAKALAAELGEDLLQGDGVQYDWAGDLSLRMMDNATMSNTPVNQTIDVADQRQANWGGNSLWTALVLSSLSFSDLTVPKQATLPIDQPDPAPDEEQILIDGKVTLRTSGNTLISALPNTPVREGVKAANNPRKITLPVGAFNFRLTGTDADGVATTKLVFDEDIPSKEACNPNNANSFVRLDGDALVLKDDIDWFKLTSGEWQSQAALDLDNDGIPAARVSIRPADEASLNDDGTVKRCVITIDIDDNDAVDNNPAIGVIDDPGAPGIGGGAGGGAAGSPLGAGGGGCSVGVFGRFDPTLPALLLAGLGALAWRRRSAR